LADDAGQPLLVLGADEGHEELSALLDVSIHQSATLSDGGGALALSMKADSDAPAIRVSFFKVAEGNPQVIPALIAELTRRGELNDDCAAIFVNLPLASRNAGERQFEQILAATRFGGAVFDVRRRLGEYPTVTAAAAALAAHFAIAGRLPDFLTDGNDRPLGGKSILILGLGRVVTGVEISPRMR
jgi:hypothetical protein